jgi:hypothetical protein
MKERQRRIRRHATIAVIAENAPPLAPYDEIAREAARLERLRRWQHGDDDGEDEQC